MSVKFIHTADWQIGKPFARISDDRKRFIVQNQRVEAVKRIARSVEETSASFVLVAGDLFDSNTADKATVSAACSAIGEIRVPVIAIPGNHDHGGPGSVWNQDFFKSERSQLAPNLFVLLQPEIFEIEEAVIFPCPLLRRHESLDCTAWLRDEQVFQGFQDKPRIVLAHGSVHGFTSEPDGDEEDHAATNRISLENLPLAEIDYIALGDWHGCMQVESKAWYSGTPENDRFPKSENHNPGHVLIVEAHRGGSPVVEQAATAGLRWSSLRHDFSGDEDLAYFQDQVHQIVESRTNQDLLRLSLSGSLGLEACIRLEEILETMEARLLRLKLDNQTMIAPTEEEIDRLTQRAEDPVLSMVARKLVTMMHSEEESARIAAAALRELHGAVSKRGAR